MAFKKQERFSIRKLSIGTCSLVIAAFLVSGWANPVLAETPSESSQLETGLAESPPVGETAEPTPEVNAEPAPVASVTEPVVASSVQPAPVAKVTEPFVARSAPPVPVASVTELVTASSARLEPAQPAESQTIPVTENIFAKGTVADTSRQYTMQRYMRCLQRNLVAGVI
ncbi:YSIRK-type signal peptide-containing protein [Streptococcus acidominimus]|uniref:Gram-positive signal peptide, YSIRK family n=1 Tax=Streptococcus acidominimus TaxID=1326 RepID=A0A1Q8ECM2_STRAI|nr:YSIRK-type signal peptide-containing protein [Streptococcus acidominimus]OLF49550.1 hypothetical protein BU200_06580 [Streptococcus acidominimus]SUN06633.1 gram-positive signal peptide, YSIRK family [Streptococcus acidominimus]